MVKPVSIKAVDDLVSKFDLFLFDQYGVLHNGVDVYEGMIDCVSRIKKAGSLVAVISNSGKRATYNAQRLAKFGFGPELIDAVISSGEVAWEKLKGSLGKGDATLRVFYLGQGDDRSAISGLPVVEVNQAADADLIIINGSEPERYSLEDYTKLLANAAKSKTLAYCTNPDRLSLVGGSVQYGPGQIAENYELAGGRVKWIGKPHAAIYEFALDKFNVPVDRVICIGDSVEHDICGAKAAGCSSVLCATGILAGMNEAELESLYLQYDAKPSYVVRRS